MKVIIICDGCHPLKYVETRDLYKYWNCRPPKPKMASVVSVLSKTPNLLKELVRVLPSVSFHEIIDPEHDPQLKKSSVLVCDFDLISKYLYELPNAKWVQGTWAGVDKLMPSVQKDKPLPYQITRFTGDHFGRIMGEYVVANIVNYERNFYDLRTYQQNKDWHTRGQMAEYRIISDLTMGILGLGKIGSRIGKILHKLGAEILAFGRRPSLPTGTEYEHVSKYYTKETLPSFLKGCDYIINVLPHTSETNGLLENDILKNCEDKKSTLINIGRSNIISETSLIKAINNNWISGAVLDVFDVEPLPETSPLWTMKEVIITPHVAGMSRAKDIAEQFAFNFHLYMKNLPLPATVDIKKGY